MAALGNVKEITVYINSGGGDVFAAQTIGNMLERNGATVIAHIDGLCASAATIVACHADKVVAAADASYMVHPPSMGVCDYLTAEDMRNCIKALDAIRGNIVTLYAKKTGKTEDECGAWMDETNWWTASEAKENGFVDEVDGEETDAVVENRNGVLFVNSVSMGLPFDKAPNFVKSRMGVKTPGGFSDTANNPGMTGTQEEEAMEIKNKDDLMKAYPDMVNEIRKDAAVDAINRERARIRDIQDMTLPGMEKTMQDALYGEHPMDATEYAIAPMIRDTPRLTGLVDTKSRYAGNTVMKKNFPGGHITIVGANSPSSLASRPIKVLLADEIDRYPKSAGTEGDPLDLAKKRQTTFWDYKTVMVSTPTIKGDSRIEDAYDHWYYNNTYGVRPAFVLPSTLVVSDDGTVSTNTAPAINASSTNLGKQNAPFNFGYTVTDADGDTLTVTEKLDGKTTATRTGVASGTALTFGQGSTADGFRRILNGSHTIQITASDGKESTSLNATFTKSVTSATVTLTTPLAVDGDITVAVLQVTGSIPDDATFKVEVTNNASDPSPVWQDATVEVKKGVNIVFTNSTAANGAAFNFRVSVSRGASGTGGYIEAISGAFQ